MPKDLLFNAQTQTQTEFACPLYIKKQKTRCPCLHVTAVTCSRCLFLSCRATTNVRNVLQRQSELKTERDGKRIDTPLAAGSALGGGELYSYPASGERKREFARTDSLSGDKRERQLTYRQTWMENLCVERREQEVG